MSEEVKGLVPELFWDPPERGTVARYRLTVGETFGPLGPSDLWDCPRSGGSHRIPERNL